jgi:uncharacterized protein (TIGR02145 family)
MKLSIKTTVDLFLLIIAVIVIHSCKKDEPTLPTLITADPVEITQTTVTYGGNITSDGGAEIIVAGICWSTSSNPSVRDKHTNDGKESGSFSSKLTGLTPNTKYYIRAYANNSAGTGYGNEVSFTTSQIVVATLTTADPTFVTANSAISGGDITFDGGDPVTERGVCWWTSSNPTITDNKTIDGSGTGSFVSNITNLQPITTYYVRAYAINSAGTSYGNEISFSTLISAPIVTTSVIASTTTFTAKSGGTVTSDGGGGPVTARGVCYSILENPTIEDRKTDEGPGLGSFTSYLIDLKANTTYNVRAYATNSTGTNYGNQVSFTTRSDTIAFNQTITYSTVRDIDGNIYKTVNIGSQTWMAENLKTTLYNDGEPIPIVTDDFAWDTYATGIFCYYENEYSNKYLYGALYNWYAVKTGKLCPDGWYVPTDPEWTILTDFLGGESGAGGRLKETGTIHWNSPNAGATNESGFTALPGGYRHYDGGFYSIGSDGMWWSATESPGNFAYYRYLFSGAQNMRSYDGSQRNGYSVRCLRDN